MSTRAQRQRQERREAGLTNGGRNLWIEDHDGAFEVYAVEADLERGLVRLVNEDAVEYVVSPGRCSCEAFAYSKRGNKRCKHLLRCRELGLLPNLAASCRVSLSAGAGGV